MGIGQINAGEKAPEEVNVIIEIPMQSDPVKYEVDKKSGAMYVDRFLTTAMHYPCNYGYIPHTLSEDSDPTDVLVITPFPLITGSVIRCRVVGLLAMEDEAGKDAKLLAVPVDKLSKLYRHIHSYQQVSPDLLATIAHFFAHYKDLEADKWVKVQGWQEASVAMAEIRASMARYETVNG